MVWCSVVLLLAAVVLVVEFGAAKEELSAAARNKQHQHSSLFVQYNVTKTLSYLWDLLEESGSTKYSYYHKCCW
jgi:hypothetical protein